MRTDADYAGQVMQRLDALGQITDEPGRLTRLFASPAMRRANDLVAGWMREAGMTVREDAVGNLVGHYRAARPGAKIFLLGSHLDTVRNAGKFDGPLGVLVAIACVQQLHDAGERLPFAVEVIGFADEEGVRYHTAYLGSRALTGTLSAADLARTDAQGVTMAEAIRRFGGNPHELDSARRDPHELLGYAEVHIEQGPLLDRREMPVGIVTGIIGQSRAEVIFTGCAAHAGTTPMALRRDALAAAAHFMVIAETLALREPGLLATIGQLDVLPGASNVVPGTARLTVDIRHPDDALRETSVELLAAGARHIAWHRGIEVKWQLVQSTASVACSPELTCLLKKAAASHLPEVLELSSGAGHDAAVLSPLTPAAMLFVRCKDGVSHHPEESVEADDVRMAIGVMKDFLRLLS